MFKSLANLAKRIAAIFNPAPLVQQFTLKPAARHKFVLLTGDLDKMKVLINGGEPLLRNFDQEAADLDLGAGFEKKRGSSMTVGDTTYVMWKHKGEVPAALKTGIRFQKDLGDMNGKTLDLSSGGLKVITPAKAVDLAAVAAAEKAARFAAVEKILAAHDKPYAMAAADFREAVSVSVLPEDEAHEYFVVEDHHDDAPLALGEVVETDFNEFNKVAQAQAVAAEGLRATVARRRAELHPTGRSSPVLARA